MKADELRAAWHRAIEKDKPHDAVRALVELETLEPREPRWSHRLGEAYRRVDAKREAASAFARAFEGYLAHGFLPRAIAMAKLAASLDPARSDLLERALPAAAPPAPRFAVAPPKIVKPAPLAPAPDAAVDEVRFRDEPGSSIEILVDDLGSSEVVLVDDDDILEVDDEPATIQADTAARASRPVAGTDRADAYAAMATFRLFASLPRDALVALATATELVEFDRNAMIAVRDERAFALYAIVSGKALVHVVGSPEIRLGEGDVIGEATLLDDGTRQADVRAETPLMTLRIDKRSLATVAMAHPIVEDVLFDLLARRLVMNLMHVSPLFTAFEPAQRLELAQKFEVRRAVAETVIAERGRRSDGLYVLLAGTVLVDTGGGTPTKLARGTAFGHASLLGIGASDATIRAATESVLLRMPAAGFASLAAQYPPVLAHLVETAGEPLPESRRVIE